MKTLNEFIEEQLEDSEFKKEYEKIVYEKDVEIVLLENKECNRK